MTQANKNFKKKKMKMKKEVKKSELINLFKVIRINNYDSDLYGNLYIVRKDEIKTYNACNLSNSDCENCGCYSLDNTASEASENLLKDLNNEFDTNFDDLEEIEDENNEEYNDYINSWKEENEEHTTAEVIELSNNRYHIKLINVDLDVENSKDFDYVEKEKATKILEEYLTVEYDEVEELETYEYKFYEHELFEAKVLDFESEYEDDFEDENED